ncbi:hypothetical protein B0O99DRAFT_602608 [Bisporella sp. PMI_857]|nr:hypothetical protein B0O99DRAFT_602608 [Bisporella sp. PMI_857]
MAMDLLAKGLYPQFQLLLGKSLPLCISEYHGARYRPPAELLYYSVAPKRKNIGSGPSLPFLSSRINALAAVVACDDGGSAGPTADLPTVEYPCGESSIYFNFLVTTSAERDLMTECTTITPILWISKDYPGIYLGIPSDQQPSGQLTGASFPKFIYASEIGGMNLESTTSIEVPKLAYNDYKFELVGLPSLESYSGYNSIRTTIIVNIERTGLSEIEYNNIEYISKMKVTNNPNLSNIELPVANIS